MSSVGPSDFRRSQINQIRISNGLARLSDDRRAANRRLDNDSHDGICVKCDGEMVARTDGRDMCPYCKRSPKNAAKYRAREAQAEAKLNAPTSEGQFDLNEDCMRINSSLSDAWLNAEKVQSVRRGKTKRPSTLW